VSKAVVRGLRQRGVDVLTVGQAGMLGASDEAHLQRARIEDRVFFTQDTDFLRLHAARSDHPGIVYALQQMSIGEIIRGLILIYEILDADEMRSRLEYL